MKKFFLLVAVIVLTITFLLSCKEDTTPEPTAAQTPIQSVIKDPAADIPIVFAYGQNGGGEAGYRIHFTRNGSVTKLFCQMATRGIYQVSFWRNSTQALLATAIIAVTDTIHFFPASITPVSVIKDTSYVFSCHVSDGSKQLHWIYRNALYKDLYPFTEGNVVVDAPLDLAYQPINITTPTFPYTYYSGDRVYINTMCDIEYVPGE